MEKKEQKELKEIRGLVLELSQKLKDVGIPVSDKVDNVVINTRAKSRFGACKVNKKMLGKSYTIEVSSEILALMWGRSPSR